jgi:hypothetical protein
MTVTIPMVMVNKATTAVEYVSAARKAPRVKAKYTVVS